MVLVEAQSVYGTEQGLAGVPKKLENGDSLLEKILKKATLVVVR